MALQASMYMRDNNKTTAKSLHRFIFDICLDSGYEDRHSERAIPSSEVLQRDEVSRGYLAT